MKAPEYTCEYCTNKATPICELCKSITSPSGRQRKPSQFVGVKESRFDKRIEEELRDYEIAEILVRCLEIGSPVPIKIVLDYNKQVCKEE